MKLLTKLRVMRGAKTANDNEIFSALPITIKKLFI